MLIEFAPVLVVLAAIPLSLLIFFIVESRSLSPDRVLS